MAQKNRFFLLFLAILTYGSSSFSSPKKCSSLFQYEVVYSSFNSFVEANQITLQDYKDFSFHASLTPEGVLKFSIFLTDSYTKTRSYLKGKELFAFMIRYFGIENINEIQGRWNADSDNYSQFHQALEKGYSSYEAAQLTWTGRQAAKFGFDKVVYVDSKENTMTGLSSVSAVFKKNNETPILIPNTHESNKPYLK